MKRKELRRLIGKKNITEKKKATKEKDRVMKPVKQMRRN